MFPSLRLGNASSIRLLEQLGPQGSNKPQRGCESVMLYSCECKYYENQYHFTDNTKMFHKKKPQTNEQSCIPDSAGPVIFINSENHKCDTVIDEFPQARSPSGHCCSDVTNRI